MPSNSAEYMREYRKKRKEAHERYDEAKPLIGALKSRITVLEEEIRHLKAELAKRPDLEGDLGKIYDRYADAVGVDRYSTRPFTPVPKRRG